MPLSKGATARLKREWLDSRKEGKPMQMNRLNPGVPDRSPPKPPVEWRTRADDTAIYREIEANNRKAWRLAILGLLLALLSIGMTVWGIATRQPALEVAQPLQPEAP